MGPNIHRNPYLKVSSIVGHMIWRVTPCLKRHIVSLSSYLYHVFLTSMNIKTAQTPMSKLYVMSLNSQIVRNQIYPYVTVIESEFSVKQTVYQLCVSIDNRLTVTRRVPLVEQELLHYPQYLRSAPAFRGVRIAQTIMLCVGHCMSFFLLLWYCLSFFDVTSIAITYLISSHFSW